MIDEVDALEVIRKLALVPARSSPAFGIKVNGCDSVFDVPPEISFFAGEDCSLQLLEDLFSATEVLTNEVIVLDCWDVDGSLSARIGVSGSGSVGESGGVNCKNAY